MVVMSLSKIRKGKKIWWALAVVCIVGMAACSLSKLFSFSSQQYVSIIENDASNPAAVETTAPEFVNADIPASSKQEAANDEFFVGYRMEREKVRGQEVAMLKEIMQSLDKDSQLKEQVSLKLMSLMQKSSLESQTEALVKSSGIKDCAAIMEGEVLTIILSQDISAEQKEIFRKTISQATAVDERKINLVTRKG